MDLHRIIDIAEGWREGGNSTEGGAEESPGLEEMTPGPDGESTAQSHATAEPEPQSLRGRVWNASGDRWLATEARGSKWSSEAVFYIGQSGINFG
jgi:hypothetical protein